jgi:hypothetical protein
LSLLQSGIHILLPLHRHRTPPRQF